MFRGMKMIVSGAYRMIIHLSQTEIIFWFVIQLRFPPRAHLSITVEVAVRMAQR
jgi:hypothetical protein